MEHAATHAAGPSSLNRLSISATTHCLTGCAIGEINRYMIARGKGHAVVHEHHGPPSEDGHAHAH